MLKGVQKLQLVDDKREESSAVETPSQDPEFGNCLIMICNHHRECDYIKYFCKLAYRTICSSMYWLCVKLYQSAFFRDILSSGRTY